MLQISNEGVPFHDRAGGDHVSAAGVTGGHIQLEYFFKHLAPAVVFYNLMILILAVGSILIYWLLQLIQAANYGHSIRV